MWRARAGNTHKRWSLGAMQRRRVQAAVSRCGAAAAEVPCGLVLVRQVLRWSLRCSLSMPTTCSIEVLKGGKLTC
jgi:hypothetical protein